MTWNEMLEALEANMGEDEPFMVRFEVFDRVENEYLTYELFHDLWEAECYADEMMPDGYVLEAWSTRNIGAGEYELIVYFKGDGTEEAIEKGFQEMGE